MKSASGQKHRRRRPRVPPGKTEPSLSQTLVPVLIAYRNIPSARQAMGRLTQLLQLSGGSLQPMLWRFDQLDEAKWREMSLRDAHHARLMVLAVPDESALEQAPDSWIHALIERAHGTSRSVLAMIGMTGAQDIWTLTFEQLSPRIISDTRKAPSTPKARARAQVPKPAATMIAAR